MKRVWPILHWTWAWMSTLHGYKKRANRIALIIWSLRTCFYCRSKESTECAFLFFFLTRCRLFFYSGSFFKWHIAAHFAFCNKFLFSPSLYRLLMPFCPYWWMYVVRANIIYRSINLVWQLVKSIGRERQSNKKKRKEKRMIELKRRNKRRRKIIVGTHAGSSRNGNLPYFGSVTEMKNVKTSWRATSTYLYIASQ